LLKLKNINFRKVFAISFTPNFGLFLFWIIAKPTITQLTFALFIEAIVAVIIDSMRAFNADNIDMEGLRNRKGRYYSDTPIERLGIIGYSLWVPTLFALILFLAVVFEPSKLGTETFIGLIYGFYFACFKFYEALKLHPKSSGRTPLLSEFIARPGAKIVPLFILMVFFSKITRIDFAPAYIIGKFLVEFLVESVLDFHQNKKTLI